MLKDQFGRVHDYLRISLTDKCNLRCTYCLPQAHYQFQKKELHLSADEIFKVTEAFVGLGIKRVRLTGGEPLLRKDCPEIIEKLATLPIELEITTNAVLLDRYFDVLEANRVKKINISIDSLDIQRFADITGRDDYDKVIANITTGIDRGFKVKLNAVAMYGVNDGEFIDFLELTKDQPIAVRFIEFMPFNGNSWEWDKVISADEIMSAVTDRYVLEKLDDGKNSTSLNYRVSGWKGTFGVIPTVTKPFCEGCNRVRLTADGNVRNCLFSVKEFDVKTPLREGKDINTVIMDAIQAKEKQLGGMPEFQDREELSKHLEGRSMIAIGG